VTSPPTAGFRWPRVRLWTQLAAFAALGVIFTHAAHLVIANRVTSRALAREQDVLGTSIARQIARQAVEPLLVDDVVALDTLVGGTVEGGRVAYCFILRGGRVVASSFPDGTPTELVGLRREGDQPVVVKSAAGRFLDVREPILDGAVGEVRIGLDLGILTATRRELAVTLGLLALAVIGAGVAAALVVGRRVARPVGEMLDATDRFDPASPQESIRPRGSLEFALLAERFNRMMVRLRSAHEEQDRARAQAAATERMAALGTLVAGVAHEVNNPIAGMKACLRRLRTEDLPAESVDEYLELMEDGVDRVEHVMGRLLDFARPRPPKLESVMLEDLSREGAALLQPLLRRRKITLVQAEGEPGTLQVKADRKEIGQALLNLILNAAYVTSEDGEIRVRYVAREGQYGIAIEDDGPGIPAEVRERVMDPFFSTKPEGDGTGLGLSVTRSIAEVHGGGLDFSFPEKGTIVTLWLRPASWPQGIADPAP
jgi:two-component system, NtrC family, sensor kinase